MARNRLHQLASAGRHAPDGSRRAGIMDRHAVRSIQRLLSLAAMVNLAQPAAASVLQVPQQYPSIQSGIVAAVDGDTVRVSAGLYLEMIDFLGKEIIVESTSGPDVTIIDGKGRARSFRSS